MPKKGYKMPEWRKLEISSRMKGKPKSDSAKKNMKKAQQELAYKKKENISHQQQNLRKDKYL